jgi:hypothetical protein
MLSRIEILRIAYVPALVQGEHFAGEEYQSPQHTSSLLRRDQGWRGPDQPRWQSGASRFGRPAGSDRALSEAMASKKERDSGHDWGQVLRDLVVMLADGGDCISDLVTLRDQPAAFGAVASTSTAWRVVAGLTKKDLKCIREARKIARAKAWQRGGTPKEIVRPQWSVRGLRPFDLGMPPRVTFLQRHPNVSETHLSEWMASRGQFDFPLLLILFHTHRYD